MKVILHVGMHKTGTTSIQESLYNTNNRKVLNNAGFCCVECWGSNNSYEITCLFKEEAQQHIALRRCGIDTSEKLVTINEKNKQNLIGSIRYCQDHNKNLIISAEQFSVLTEAEIFNCKNYITNIIGEDVLFEIVVCTRNLYTYAPSCAQTSITFSIQTYNKALQVIMCMSQDLYRNTITKFANVFGIENLKVYSFESNKCQQNLVGYFFEMIGVSKSTVDKLTIIRDNDGVSDFASEILEFLNNEYKNIYDEFLPYSEIDKVRRISGNKFALDREAMLKIHEMGKDDIAWLKTNYGINYELNDFNSLTFKKEILDLTAVQALECMSAYFRLDSKTQPIMLGFLIYKFNQTGSEIFSKLEKELWCIFLKESFSLNLPKMIINQLRNDNNKPMISVVMPIYNCQTYLQNSIESICNQSYANFEFIIVNANSSDLSLEIARRYEQLDKRIHVIETNTNNIIDALNIGLDNAKYDFIARTDVYDINKTQRIEKQIEYLLEHTEIDLVGANVSTVSDKETMFNFQYDKENLEYYLLNLGLLCHSTWMFKKELLQMVGGYDKEYLGTEDYDFLLRAYKKGANISTINEDLVDYLSYISFNNYPASRQNYEFYDSSIENVIKIKLNYLETKIDFNKISVSIWGAGKVGTACYHILKERYPSINIVCYYDNYKSGEYNGIPIYNVSEIKFGSQNIIIGATVFGKEEILKFMKENNKCLLKDYIILSV